MCSPLVNVKGGSAFLKLPISNMTDLALVLGIVLTDAAGGEGDHGVAKPDPITFHTWE